MIPKIHNSFEAIKQGVEEVFIGASDDLALLELGTFGTRLLK
jgi:acetylglutamate kinase